MESRPKTQPLSPSETEKRKEKEKKKKKKEFPDIMEKGKPMKQHTVQYVQVFTIWEKAPNISI